MNCSTKRFSLRGTYAWAALVFALAPGCAAPFMTSYLSGSRRLESENDATASDAPLAPNDPKAAALRKANGQGPATPEEALAGVLEQLEEIRAIDPAAQQEVMADLKAAKPEHYALIVDQFRAALAYKQQLAEREHEEQMQIATDSPDSLHATDTGAAPRRSLTKVTPASNQTLAARRAVTQPSATYAQAAAPLAEAPFAAAATHIVTAAPTAPVDQLLTAAATTVATGPDASLLQATSLAPIMVGGDWHKQLDAAINDLQRTVKPQPATVGELHDHFRLRALQLVAGREEEAYLPIPGASPAQQEYWSKQLFAMAAYLSSSQQLDDKQRAAAALVHLDEARSSLAQLATLQVRNLVFVTRIDGFGAYEPLTATHFEPDAEVTLYAEVENFACAPSVDGYETRLASSYRVVDASGRQVDGMQFPEVVDVCQSRRRDFHLQFGFRVPVRISPGEYRVEITITDQHSGKIGHASAPFEVNAAR